MNNQEKHDATYGSIDWCKYWGIDFDDDAYDEPVEPYDEPDVD